MTIVAPTPVRLSGKPLKREPASWGRFPAVQQERRLVRKVSDGLPIGDAQTRTFLPYGNGRSYGDSA